MRELQRTFAYLCCTKKATYDPVAFIDALSLSHIVQQDGKLEQVVFLVVVFFLFWKRQCEAQSFEIAPLTLV